MNATQYWNRCDECGRFISFVDFYTGKATRILLTPNSEYTKEEYETLCHKHRILQDLKDAYKRNPF